MSSIEIRHIVFDIGKVLIHYDPHIPYTRLIPDDAERNWFFANVCTHDWNIEQDRGRDWQEAEALLIEVKPHLFAITSDYQPAMRNGDAWLTMCWTGDAKQLNRDIPEIHYALGKEGGEIWSDFYTIPTSAPNREGAYALLNYLLDPQVNAKEAMFHGYPVPDARVEALMSDEMRNDPILHPAADLLSALEFGAAVTLTDPNRAEIMARFKAA